MDQKQMDGGGPHVSLDSTLPTYFGFVRRGGDGKEVQFIEGPTRSATHVMGVFDDMTTLSLDLKSAGSLEPLAPGQATWNEEQSRKQFESISRLITPANRPESRLLIHPLAPEAGGDLFHSGGRQFESKDDPDYKILMQWAGVK